METIQGIDKRIRMHFIACWITPWTTQDVKYLVYSTIGAKGGDNSIQAKVSTFRRHIVVSSDCCKSCADSRCDIRVGGVAKATQDLG